MVQFSHSLLLLQKSTEILYFEVVIRGQREFKEEESTSSDDSRIFYRRRYYEDDSSSSDAIEMTNWPGERRSLRNIEEIVDSDSYREESHLENCLEEARDSSSEATGREPRTRARQQALASEKSKTVARNTIRLEDLDEILSYHSDN